MALSSAFFSAVLIACTGFVVAIPQGVASPSGDVATTTVSSAAGFPSGECSNFAVPTSFAEGPATTAWASGSSIFFPPVQTVTVTVFGCNGSGSAGPGSGGGSPPTSVPAVSGSGPVVGPPTSVAASKSKRRSSAVGAGPPTSRFGGPPTSVAAPQASGPFGGGPPTSVSFPQPTNGSPVACYCYPVDLPSSCGFATATGVPFPPVSSGAIEPSFSSGIVSSFPTNATGIPVSSAA